MQFSWMNLECHPGSFFYDTSNSIKAMDLYWEFEARNKSLKKARNFEKERQQEIGFIIKSKEGIVIRSKAKEKCNSSHCIAFGSEFNEKFQKNWIFFSRSPLRHLISNSVGSSILCSAAINFNTSLAAAVQSKRLHNGVKTILLCQNYFIVSKLFYCVKPWRF